MSPPPHPRWSVDLAAKQPRTAHIRARGRNPRPSHMGARPRSTPQATPTRCSIGRPWPRLEGLSSQPSCPRLEPLVRPLLVEARAPPRLGFPSDPRLGSARGPQSPRPARTRVSGVAVRAPRSPHQTQSPRRASRQRRPPAGTAAKRPPTTPTPCGIVAVELTSGSSSGEPSPAPRHSRTTGQSCRTNATSAARILRCRHRRRSRHHEQMREKSPSRRHLALCPSAPPKSSRASRHRVP